MDAAKLILTGPVSMPEKLAEPARAAKAANEQKERAAKDFESLFVSQVLEQMKDTIPDSGLLEDSTSKQVKGLFWLYLGRDIASKGGFGLWKNIYRTLTQAGRQ